jgi:glyoxylase-like metal-dependent hydrolase (beta-lactamase superfamily II)
METIVSTPAIRILRIPDVGPEANNVYLVIDVPTGESAFVDAPADAEKWIDAAEGTRPARLLITHTHSDHTASVELLKERFGLQVLCHPAEPWLDASKIDVRLADGDTVQIGTSEWTAIANPGHTPGSTSFFRQDVHGAVLFSGDTLFPGGPGWTATPLHLRREIESIRDKLLVLPPETAVYPGHGAATTIRQSRAEYKVFESKPHPDDLHGDVLWMTS